MPGPIRRRRRWWVYLLWLLGAACVLVVTLVVSAILYWNHLVRTYTSTQARPLPTIEGAAEKYPVLKERWDAYALQFLHPEREIPEFELTAEELNVFALHFGPFGKNAFVELRDKDFRIQFCAPLDTTGKDSLRGRYLNGIATITPHLANGQLDLRISKLEANGRPAPGWILRQTQKWNLAERLNHRPEFDLAVRALDRLEVDPDKVVLHPRTSAKAR